MLKDIQITLNEPGQFQEYTLSQPAVKSFFSRVFNDKLSQLRDSDKRFQIPTMNYTYPPQMAIDDEPQFYNAHYGEMSVNKVRFTDKTARKMATSKDWGNHTCKLSEFAKITGLFFFEQLQGKYLNDTQLEIALTRNDDMSSAIWSKGGIVPPRALHPVVSSDAFFVTPVNLLDWLVEKVIADLQTKSVLSGTISPAKCKIHAWRRKQCGSFPPKQTSLCQN